MSVAPNAGLVDLDTFLPPSGGNDGLQGQVPKPLAGQENYVLTASGFSPAGSIPGLGTMATQNANAVAITGGAIDNTPIGGTTPAAGTFTTLTAQTEVLKGSGNNLFLQSGLTGGTSGTLGTTAVAPTSWSFITTANGGTVTYASALSGSGNSIRMAGTSVRTGINQTVTLISGETYSFSYNVETVTSAGNLQLQNLWLVNGPTVTAAYYVNGSSVAASTVPTSNTKVQVVFTLTSSGGSFQFRWGMGIDGPYTGDITVSNPQLEIGSVLNTYVPTTTTAIYGTPTLSFSGVAGLGLQSDGSLYVSPAGTGAIQAQATTSSATGGNARGIYAVDLQMQRGSAGRVASGSNGFIGAGYDNAVSGGYSVVAGGYSNASTASQAAVLGGKSNIASGISSVIVGGLSNTSTGYYNFIGGGYTNSGTANAAVTTQSGTMNGTTAVTLSGSNASIKVGQYITGTSIAGETYVAAISGTSLTLSQAASGSSTSTLSFYTPHGVVVGGGNNQATGSYSFIGGGGDAGTAANRNVASGDWSVVVGGWKNTASGLASFVGGGGSDSTNAATGNTASGLGSAIVGGNGNSASGIFSSIAGGSINTASATASSVIGGSYGTTRAIVGNTVAPSSYTPLGSFSTGQSQSASLVLARQTTDATPTVLASNSSAASGTNQVILPNNSAYYFRGTVVAGVTGGGNTKGWTIEGVIKRGANAAATSIVGTATVLSSYADAGAATWALTATADTTNGGLAITFTGQAATTIRVVAKLETTEMTF